MGESDTTSTSGKIEYVEALWGELYYGTKADLQSIGIAVQMAFPGEPGGPKSGLQVRDPRGFKVIVAREYDGRYCATISLPGRERPDDTCVGEWISFAPGVKRRANWYRIDEYIGTAEALAAAGLIRPDQLPGQPGMNKVRVTIFSDGTICPRHTKHKRSREPGARTITRTSKATYTVRVTIPADEQKHRLAAAKRADEEYEARMQVLPRPTPLTGVKSRSRQQTARSIEDYRNEVKDAAALFFEVIEKYMFNPAECAFKNYKNGGPVYSPEVREALLGHQKSIWQELKKLIDEGCVITKTSGNRPMLHLVRD